MLSYGSYMFYYNFEHTLGEGWVRFANHLAFISLEPGMVVPSTQEAETRESS